MGEHTALPHTPLLGEGVSLAAITFPPSLRNPRSAPESARRFCTLSVAHDGVGGGLTLLNIIHSRKLSNRNFNNLKGEGPRTCLKHRYVRWVIGAVPEVQAQHQFGFFGLEHGTPRPGSVPPPPLSSGSAPAWSITLPE